MCLTLVLGSSETLHCLECVQSLRQWDWPKWRIADSRSSIFYFLPRYCWLWWGQWCCDHGVRWGHWHSTQDCSVWQKYKKHQDQQKCVVLIKTILSDPLKGLLIYNLKYSPLGSEDCECRHYTQNKNFQCNLSSGNTRLHLAKWMERIWAESKCLKLLMTLMTF